MKKKPSDRKAYICQWLGRVSYPLYFSHYVITDFLQVWIDNGNYWFDYTCIMVIGLLLVCLAIGNLVEEIYHAPVQKWLSSILLK